MRVRLALLACVVFAALLTATAQAAETVLSGNVSRAGLTIASGDKVTFDPSTSTTLTVTGNVVVDGELEMRPARPRVVHKIVFAGVDEANYVGGGMEVLASDVGLWVRGAGVLDAAGSAKTSWLRANDGLAAGATSVTLNGSPSGWRVGDELAVTPTLPPTVANHDDAYDYPKIASISGNVVAFDRALTFDHPKVNGQWAAEVLNLTRNVNVEGTPTGRGHIMFLPGAPQHISNIGIRHMGPRQGDEKVAGRYALHFHMLQDASRGSTVTGVVVRDSGSHAFVPHASHGITFTGTVAHNVMEDAYWWDKNATSSTFDDTETNDTTWRDTVASRVTADPQSQSQGNLTGYLLGAGTGNRCLGCVAVGVQGVANASGYHWPSKANGNPNVWEFSGAVGHNNNARGIFVWQNTPTHHLVADSVLYHNGGGGIHHGAYVNGYVYRNLDIFGNAGPGIQIHAVSHPKEEVPLLAFESVRVTADDVAVEFFRHNPNIEVTRPTLFLNSTLNAPRPVIIANEREPGSWADIVDSVSGPEAVTFVEPTAPSAVARVQTGDRAWRMTPDAITEIDPFYPY